ncbi:MAG: transferase [Candidatus Bathyarchaeota archaeon]|nr:MAG: transferase [Candidatus Bathyarchaeota archaeon]
MSENAVIYERTKIGKNPVVEDFVVLGKPPSGFKPGQLELVIGDFPTIRSGTIIYAGNIIGNRFQTGDNARIRENNRIGDSVSIGAGSVVECGCEMKDYARIHSNCFISEYTIINENAWIGPGVNMTNVLHPPCPAFKKHAPIRGERCLNGPVINKCAVIGAGATILPGVVIGESAIVGAGSVVNSDIPERCVVAGNPAKVVKKIGDLDCPLGFYKRGEVYSWRRK